MNNKILVTGANGLLGRYILSSFLLHDYEVYALVQSIPRNTNPDIKYIEVELIENKLEGTLIGPKIYNEGFLEWKK